MERSKLWVNPRMMTHSRVLAFDVLMAGVACNFGLNCQKKHILNVEHLSVARPVLTRSYSNGAAERSRRKTLDCIMENGARRRLSDA